jgi:hypothetical protein
LQRFIPLAVSPQLFGVSIPSFLGDKNLKKSAKKMKIRHFSIMALQIYRVSPRDLTETRFSWNEILPKKGFAETKNIGNEISLKQNSAK